MKDFSTFDLNIRFYMAGFINMKNNEWQNMHQARWSQRTKRTACARSRKTASKRSASAHQARMLRIVFGVAYAQFGFVKTAFPPLRCL